MEVSVAVAEFVKVVVDGVTIQEQAELIFEEAKAASAGGRFRFSMASEGRSRFALAAA